MYVGSLFNLDIRTMLLSYREVLIRTHLIMKYSVVKCKFYP